MNRTIVCLKWGDKYSPQYVNVLYNMCKRHNSEKFDFVCLTENSHGLHPDIIVKQLPNLPLQGWWLKPYIFCKDNNIVGNVLFLDLDIIIYDNIDKLWNYMPNDFVIIRDFNRHVSSDWKKFNSSVFKFNSKECYWIWEKFYKEYKTTIHRLHGDQDFLFSILKESAKYWPDHWIQSYKWEMRNRNEVQYINGKRNFINVKDPTLTDECCIAVFHGEPNPHDVKDPWVIENWR